MSWGSTDGEKHWWVHTDDFYSMLEQLDKSDPHTAQQVRKLAGVGRIGIVVFTNGERMKQLDTMNNVINSLGKAGTRPALGLAEGEVA